jgi:hypothetical protein
MYLFAGRSRRVFKAWLAEEVAAEVEEQEEEKLG